jgi:hypothetical protein
MGASWCYGERDKGDGYSSKKDLPPLIITHQEIVIIDDNDNIATLCMGHYREKERDTQSGQFDGLYDSTDWTPSSSFSQCSPISEGTVPLEAGSMDGGDGDRSEGGSAWDRRVVLRRLSRSSFRELISDVPPIA